VDGEGSIGLLGNLRAQDVGLVRSDHGPAPCAGFGRHTPGGGTLLGAIDAGLSQAEALRRTEARTRQELDAAITTGLATITATEARGWFAHCGYPIPAHPL
jgi:hypothetical protein